MQSNVTVLTPNGRRTNVKINPNTTMLQILENACSKQNYDPKEYDLKHHKRILDISSTFRFSGLPNNAQLELVPATKTRIESEVYLCLQLENGERLIGNFQPSDSLHSILNQLYPEGSKEENNPVILYMRQEIFGDALKTTNLRNIGIFGGRVILRLVHKTPEQLKQQANISAPLPSKPVEEKPYKRKLITSSEKCQSQLSETSENIKTCQETLKKTISDEKMEVSSSEHVDNNEKKLDEGNILGKKETIKEPQDDLEGDKLNSVSNIEPIEISADEQKCVDDVNKILKEDRNALIFSLNDGPSLSSYSNDTLDDSFFELTVNDVKKLFLELKKRREELFEKPLETSEYKKLEESKKILNNIGMYKVCCLRIQFPDRNVLQANFKPIETIVDVMNFVRKHLVDNTLEFYLFTAPPKQILVCNKRLIEADCVPSAILYFGTDQILEENSKFLREDTLIHTTIDAAILTASKSRNLKSFNQVEPTTYLEPTNSTDELVLPSCSKNTNNVSVTSGITSTQKNYDDTKVPKWFRPVKK